MLRCHHICFSYREGSIMIFQRLLCYFGFHDYEKEPSQRWKHTTQICDQEDIRRFEEDMANRRMSRLQLGGWTERGRQFCVYPGCKASRTVTRSWNMWDYDQDTSWHVIPD